MESGGVIRITQSRQVRALLMFLGLACLVWVLANWIISGSTWYFAIKQHGHCYGDDYH